MTSDLADTTSADTPKADSSNLSDPNQNGAEALGQQADQPYATGQPRGSRLISRLLPPRFGSGCTPS
ncbi:MAG: hypothetical protein HC929_21710 [Leptolyngbyaceae cyanobacterium SM2_5_2]|nr:hypothetical protein [Leptolyngbyaceae cyanobacterium SM2_5_2]